MVLDVNSDFEPTILGGGFWGVLHGKTGEHFTKSTALKAVSSSNVSRQSDIVVEVIDEIGTVVEVMGSRWNATRDCPTRGSQK